MRLTKKEAPFYRFNQLITFPFMSSCLLVALLSCYPLLAIAFRSDSFSFFVARYYVCHHVYQDQRLAIRYLTITVEKRLFILISLLFSQQSQISIDMQTTKVQKKKINNNNNNFLGLTDSVGSDVWAVHLRPIGWKRCKYNARNPTKERKFYTFFSSEIAKKKKNM